MGPQDPAGRQGKVTKHQDSAELGPVGRSAAHQVHPCGGGAVNGRRVALPYPGILQSLSKYPLAHCPTDPSSPLWGQENRGRVLVQWFFWLQALDPCKDTRPPGDGPDTFVFLLDPSHWDPGHPSLSMTTHTGFPDLTPTFPSQRPKFLAEAAGGAWPQQRPGSQEDGGSRVRTHLWRISSLPATCGSHCPPAPGPHRTEWPLRW